MRNNVGGGKKAVKILSLTVAFASVGVTLLFLFGKSDFSPRVEAGSADNVSGWAWSENVGWISFNCTDQGTCGSVDYGVDIDPATGDFSGYAWSDNIGWIKFDPAGPYPEAPNYSACLDLPGSGQTCDGVGDYLVSGWARACAAVADKNTCEGAADPNAGGWEGWIKMRCDGAECSVSNYGVSWDPSTSEMAGWAWSDMVIGWISFNCEDTADCGTSAYKVFADVNRAPTADELSASQPIPCDAGGDRPTFSWRYRDDDGDEMKQFEVEVWTEGFGDLVKNYGIQNGVASSGSTFSYTPSSLGNLTQHTVYSWKVRVQDSKGSWSDWINAPSSFQLHKYPIPAFSYTPQNPSIEEPLQFSEESTIRDPGAEKSTTDLNFRWTFQDGNPSQTEEMNPTVTFSNSADKTKDITLKVRDTNGHQCEKTFSAGVQLKQQLPKFFPVIPF